MKKVLVTGCFNRIHPGHIYLFEKAKKLGDYLIVLLTHDVNNDKIYKTSTKDRIKLLESIKTVDKIVVGDRKKSSKILNKENIDIIVLGYDQSYRLSEKTNKDIIIKRIKKYKNYKTSFYE